MTTSPLVCRVLVCCAVFFSHGYAADDATVLLKDVTAAPLGSAGPIAVLGPHAFPLLYGGEKNQYAVVAAAAQVDKGRIVAFGHDSALKNKSFLTDTNTGALLLNAINWCQGKQSGAIGVRGANGIQDLLTKHKIPFISLSKKWTDDLPKIKVLISDVGGFGDDASIAATLAFLKKGGGLITAGTAWGWAQGHRNETIRDDYPLNKLCLSIGLAFGDGSTKSDDKGFLPVPAELANQLHAVDALAILKDPKADYAQASATILSAVNALTTHDTFLIPKLSELAKTYPALIPTKKNPITTKKHPVERVLIAYEEQRLRALTPDTMIAAPAANDFPGSVPADAKDSERTLPINTAIPDWHSTGLYAAPGKKITVQIPDSFIKSGLSVRIGAHKDRVWHKDNWDRWPAISWETNLTEKTTYIANPFGGAIYIDVPNKIDETTIPVTIKGGVAAPLFVLGKTTAAEWKKEQQLPGPWAELVARRIILTVPSSVIRELEDPTAVLEFWDQAIDAEDKLADWQADKMRRPERFVCDRQISAGYMHSGYPIMAHMDVADDNVQLALLKGNFLKPGGWGQWHELGHNHQHRFWTPGNQGEVTVNLFSLRVQLVMYGCKPENVWGGNLAPAKRAKGIAKYLADANSTPNNWPFDVGLMFYWQLIDGHGWDVLHNVIASYRLDPPKPEPKSDPDKWSQWLRRYSKEAKKDLGPFFAKWRIPTDQTAFEFAKSQGPVWMHTDMEPPKVQ